MSKLKKSRSSDRPRPMRKRKINLNMRLKDVKPLENTVVIVIAMLKKLHKTLQLSATIHSIKELRKSKALKKVRNWRSILSLIKRPWTKLRHNWKQLDLNWFLPGSQVRVVSLPEPKMFSARLGVVFLLKMFLHGLTLKAQLTVVRLPQL